MLNVYNTLSGKKEEFVPLKDGEVGMYACGVTVYDHSHLGHARGAVVFDVIRRYLMHKGYRVKYVRNFTDVDDKIIKRAAELGVGWKDIAEKYTLEYIKDMDALGVDRPDVEPKATDHIGEIIEIVKRLVERGYAYASGGDVFFSVRKFEGYGKLSKKPIDEMESGARVDVNEQKKDPLDFALWKASKPGEPSWGSPWGPGRPGWHIECSAMSAKHLGDTFDIHCGGMDLQFPHHENEIAQSEAASGRMFVKYWMHNGFVNVNKEKMSKSLGNFFTIKEILAAYEPEAIRLFLLSTHYRHPIDFSGQSLRDAKAALDRYYTMKEALDGALMGYKAGGGQVSDAARALDEKTSEFNARFYEAMDDDFNTSAVIGAIFEMVREINRTLTEPALKTDGSLVDALYNAREQMDGKAGILNLFGTDPAVWFGRGTDTVEVVCKVDELQTMKESLAGFGAVLRETGDGGHAISAKDIEALIDARNKARSEKDWARADKVRDLLALAGIELLDGAEGTKWQKKV